MYAQYTRVFETCKEPQKSIKFSPFYRGRGPQKILLYFWGEGVNEQKTNKRKKEFVWSKARFATRTRLRTNPPRTPKTHQNSDFLGKLILCLFYSVRSTMSLRGIAKLGSPRDTVYSRGKGVCKHKTTDCRLRQSVGQKRSIRRISRKGYHITIKCCLGRSFALNRNKFSTLKTAYFQRIYFLFFLFKISKCINV